MVSERASRAPRRMFVIAAFSVSLFLICCFWVSRSADAQTTSSVTLSPGENIESVVSSSPTGTEFTFTPGVYRLQSIVPKDGDSFVGQSGAIIDGAILIPSSSWQQASSTVWTANVKGIVEESSYRGQGHCDSTHPACYYPEDLFFDSLPLTRVSSVSSVGPGEWYLDYATGTVYVGSDPSDHATEMSALRAAFQGSASDVTISNLTIEKYASIAGYGAIEALSPSGAPSSDWVVESDDLLLNHGMGLRVSNGMVVRDNKIRDNGQMGLGGSGNNILIEGNAIYKNDYAGYYFGWESGGAKVDYYSKNVTFKDNNVYDNGGPGLWADISDDDFLFENNHTTGNIEAGILYEISYHATIRDNVIEDDGYGSPHGTSIWFGSGILISNSSDVNVHDNTVTNCMNGVGGIQTNRGNDPKTGLPYELKNLDVYNNTITQQVNYAAGIVRSGTDNSVYTSWGNQFQANTYNLYFPAHLYFIWMGKVLTFAQWQAYGLD